MIDDTVNHEDLEHLTKTVELAFKTYSENINKTVSLLEERLVLVEKINGVMVTAWAEIAGLVDGLYDTVTKDYSENELRTLETHIKALRSNLFETLNDKSGLVNRDKNDSPTVDDMVE